MGTKLIVEQKDPPPKFDLEKFIFDVPLYEVQGPLNDKDLFFLMAQSSRRINGFCPFCESDSVFHVASGTDKATQGPAYAFYECARTSFHQIRVEMHLTEKDEGRFVRKIGQYPSHADISNPGLKKVSKVLEKQDRTELVRAHGLASHGVNIGAYIYLRRVLERLVQRTFEKHKVQLGLSDDDFRSAKMVEKIKMLEGVIPAFLVENARIYGVLSKGVHELDEDTCGKYYTLLHESIILILEMEEAQREREQRESIVKKALDGIDLS